MQSLGADVRRVCERLGVEMVRTRPSRRSTVLVEVRTAASEVIVHHGPLNEKGLNIQVEIALDDLFAAPPYRELKREITPNGLRYTVTQSAGREPC